MNWILVNLDAIAPLIPVTLLVINYKMWKLKELLYLLLYLLSLAVFNGYADLLSYFDPPNYWVYHVNLLYSFPALIYFFKHMGAEIYFKVEFFYAGILLIPVFIFNTFFYEKINTFNSISYAVACVYVLAVCLKYFWLKARSDLHGDILRSADFWFISGLFIYYCSSLIVFSSYRIFINTNDQMAGVTWKFQSIMLLIMCILLNKGINLKIKCQTQ